MRIRTLIAAFSALLVALAPVGQAHATNPPPPKNLQTPGIDAHLGYKPQKSCSPAAKPGTTALLKALIATWGGSSWGISRFCASGGTSEHKEGRALDWHMDSRKAKDRAKVNDVIKWITSNNGEVAYRLGVMYIIWNQKIWSIYYQELGWRKMSNRGSRTANHKDHVHISLSWDGAMAQTSWWTGRVLTVPKLGPCDTRSYGSCLSRMGRSSARTWPKVTVGPFSPYPSTVPEIAGSPRVGLTLRVVPGTWTPAGATVSYQWVRDGKTIPGANAVDYRVAAADVGSAISVRVRASLGATTLTKTSPGTTDTVRGILSKPRPTVAGQFSYGSTLTGTPGNFGTSVTLRYQWQRDNKDISGATSAQYTLVAGDVGHDVRLRVRASKSGYSTVYTYSSAREVKPLTFTAAPQPTISGILRVGGVLKVVPGAWNPAAKFSYRWYRAGNRVSGRTNSSYQLTSADRGKGISVRVRGTQTGYKALNRYSVRSAVVRSGLGAATPKISDTTPRVGQLLTVDPGSWKPSGVAFSYRWYRDGKAINGATGRSYTVPAADYGAPLKVRVEGALAGYPNLARSSRSASDVGAGLFRAGKVTVTGTAAVGQTLTANEGTWKSRINAARTLAPAFSYQWYAAGKAIRGATSKALALTTSLKGKKVHVMVTARSSRYATAGASSASVTIA